MSWNEVEEMLHREPAAGKPRLLQLAPSRQRRDDVLASLRVWLLMCTVSLTLLLEDDAAMIALAFC